LLFLPKKKLKEAKVPKKKKFLMKIILNKIQISLEVPKKKKLLKKNNKDFVIIK
jgi:hypothetical protein